MVGILGGFDVFPIDEFVNGVPRRALREGIALPGVALSLPNNEGEATEDRNFLRGEVLFGEGTRGPTKIGDAKGNRLPQGRTLEED